MTAISLSPELIVALAGQLAIVIAAFVWVKADVNQTKKDIHTIKVWLGQENGDDPAFVRTSNCVLMEKEVDRRLAEVVKKVEDAAAKADHAVEVAQAESSGIQYRLAAVELTLKVLANKA